MDVVAKMYHTCLEKIILSWNCWNACNLSIGAVGVTKTSLTANLAGHSSSNVKTIWNKM